MSVAPKNELAGSAAETPSTSVKAEVVKEKKTPKPTPAKPAEMSGEVIEFIQAIDEYKRLQQRPFPSWSEVLDILKDLGYEKP